MIKKYRTWHFLQWTLVASLKGDVTWDDRQRRFLRQHRIAVLSSYSWAIYSTVFIWLTKLKPRPNLMRYIRKIHIFPANCRQMEWLFSWFTVISPPNHLVACWLALIRLFGGDYIGGEMTGYRFPSLPFLFWLLSRVTADLYTLLLRQKQHWIVGQQLRRLLCSAMRSWYGTKVENRSGAPNENIVQNHLT